MNNWNFASTSNNENLVGNNRSRFGALPNGGRFYAYNTGYTNQWGASRSGYYDITERAWWWTSTMEDRYWNTNQSGATNDAIMPYHITMDNATNTIYNNYVVAWNTYGYLWRSVLTGGDYRFLYNNYGSGGGYNSGHNVEATRRIWNEFYMGVRCVRD